MELADRLLGATIRTHAEPFAQLQDTLQISGRIVSTPEVRSNGLGICWKHQEGNFSHLAHPRNRKGHPARSNMGRGPIAMEGLATIWWANEQENK